MFLKCSDSRTILFDMIDILPDSVRKGRGAVGNPTGRFEHDERLRIDDGWWQDEDDLAPRLATQWFEDASRSVIARNKSPDIPFDRSINPYRGCEHGCIYCFARPTHAYLNLSPGLDFETKIFVKKNAPELLAGELRRPGYTCAPIGLGVNTDAYQPLEKDFKITRGILEVLNRFHHPVTILTKSSRILRDVDILGELAASNLVHVMVSVTTLDSELARRMEPRAGTPTQRLQTIEALNKAGIPAGVLASPMIPAINDMELERILEACSAAGAEDAGYILLRLPLELKELFSDWLEAHYPDRAAKTLNLIRQCRDGRLNAAGFGERMSGKGPYADMLSKRFKNTCRRLGLNQREAKPDLECGLFQPPPLPGDQLTLL